MPKEVLGSIRNDHAGNPHVGDMITPSALKGCVRKTVLERTTNYYQTPLKLYYAVRGSLIHGFLENHGLPNIHSEKRLFKKVNVNGRDIVISGQIDSLDEADFRITDYKTMSDKGTWFLFNEGAKPEHIDQTNVYRWLAYGGHLGSLNGPQVFWKVDEIVIAYLFMNRVVQTGGTHFEEEATYKSPNNGRKWKLEKSRKKVRKNARGVPVWQIEYEIPPVPLYTEDKIMALIEKGADSLKKGFEIAEVGGLPPGVLYDKDGAWACDYCGVRKQCHNYESQQNPEKFIKLINANASEE